MKTKLAILILSVVIFAAFMPAKADSIWARRDKKMKDMYADKVARNIGDILTIKINEDSQIDNKAKRTLEKKTQRSAEFNGKVGIDHIIPNVPSVTLGTGDQYSNKLDGKADYKDERSFTDYVTVVIVDIMPNGNLVVAGTRDRNIAGDTQKIEISGVVRTEDIAFDNTIDSKRVANFQIVTKNDGISTPYTQPNWLGRIFDKIWLF